MPKERSLTQCSTHGMDFVFIDFLQLSLIWWDTCHVEVAEPVWPFVSHWALAGNPLLTHSCSLWVGVCCSWRLVWWDALVRREPALLLVSCQLRKLLGIPSEELQFYFSADTFVFRTVPSPFLQQVSLPIHGWCSESLVFLLVCIRCWQGIGCFCKNSASSVPDNKDNLLPTWSHLGSSCLLFAVVC